MQTNSLIRNRHGMALFMTLLVSIAVAGIAMGGILLASGAQLATKYNAQEASLEASADGGLEIARDSLNRGSYDSLLPVSGYSTLLSQAAVTDASGNTLPRINLSIYVGRTGGRTGGAATAGQYGSNFASALSIISNARGAVAARRLLMTQESWAKFAVAINNWSGSAAYGCDESVNGPFFSNTGMSLSTPCGPSPHYTLFAGLVQVVTTITNVGSGNFTKGYQQGVASIPWPTPAKIATMRQFAQDADIANGDYDLTSPTLGSKIPGLRIEFLTIDLNGNGVIDPDEGFMRVWYSKNTSDTVLAYATGRRWPRSPTGVALDNSVSDTNPNLLSRNCGSISKLNGAGSNVFRTAGDVYAGTTGSTSVKALAVDTLLTHGTPRCYLGGDPHLFAALGTLGDTLTPDSAAVTNTATFPFGWWKKRHQASPGSLATVRSGDKSYLIPLGANINFKGVIFVTGDVAISGVLRGRATVVATGNIILDGDLLYTNPPGTKCDQTGDIFGAIATKDVIIEDNSLHTPFPIGPKISNKYRVVGGFNSGPPAENGANISLPGVNYNMFFMAAGDSTGTTGNWYGEGDDMTSYFASSYPQWVAFAPRSPFTLTSSATSQQCNGAANGCVSVHGGLDQGRVDDWTYYPSDYGWAETHTYDPCGAIDPPPYFPTTGRFIVSRYYEIDPVWLNSLGISAYFTSLQSQ